MWVLTPFILCASYYAGSCCYCATFLAEMLWSIFHSIIASSNTSTRVLYGACMQWSAYRLFFHAEKFGIGTRWLIILWSSQIVLDMNSGVFRGRATMRCPPLAKPWKFFTGDFIWKGAFFAIFQQELQNSTMFDGLLRFQISEKWANLRFPLNIQKQKVFQLQGGEAPLTPRPGAVPCPPLPNPKYPKIYTQILHTV